MKRWLFNITAGVSLLVGLLVIILWIRSELVEDSLTYNAPPASTHQLSLFARLERGDITVGYQTIFWTPRQKQLGQQMAAHPSTWDYCRVAALTHPDANTSTQQLWFERKVGGFVLAAGIDFKATSLFIPDWFLLLLSGVLPTLWIRRFMRSRRATPGGFEVVLPRRAKLLTTPPGGWNE